MPTSGDARPVRTDQPDRRLRARLVLLGHLPALERVELRFAARAWLAGLAVIEDVI